MQSIGLMQVFAFSHLLCRRTDGETRGSKCLASGRPALGTKRASKRPRNLENAISYNQPNAKSHGSGH
jgi:hypothetical protein